MLGNVKLYLSEKEVVIEAPKLIKGRLERALNDDIIQEVIKVDKQGVKIKFSIASNTKLRALAYLADMTCGDDVGIKFYFNYKLYTIKKNRNCPLFSGIKLYKKNVLKNNTKLILSISALCNKSYSRYV